jgi:trehalose-phosphatase
MNDLSRLFQTMAEALATGGSLLFLSDFDGTLSRLVDHPDAAGLAREVGENLRSLARAPHVGVVSGRALHDLRFRVRVSELIYAGCHGLEITGPGLRFRHPEAEAQRGELTEIADDVVRRLRATPGVLVERKGLCVAVHYRHVVAGGVATVEHELNGIMRSRRGFALLPGKHVFDIVPTVAWDEGHCVRHVRDHVLCQGGTDPTIVYLRDDTSDEIAFTGLKGEAITVRVGAEGGIGLAMYRLRDVSDVHCLIDLLAQDIASRSSRCV